MKSVNARASAIVLSLMMVLPLGIQIAQSQHLSEPIGICEFLQIVNDTTFDSSPNFAPTNLFDSKA
jgi:hypothetical protein